MAEIFLRPYQQKFIDDVRQEFYAGHKRIVGVAPCGAGKTIMTGWMIREALIRGKKSIFFVHRHELIEQTSKTFSDLDIPHGIIASGVKMNLDLPVQIASVQTLVRRLKTVPASDFLICDECHHILANSYKKILDEYQDAFLLGVTATPQRMGGINLGDVFTSMVESLSVNDLIRRGNLTKFKYFATSENIDLNKVKSHFGEFDNADLENVMSDRRIIGNIVENYLRRARGKSAICYCVNVRHSKKVSAAFRKAGIRAFHVDGDTPKADRKFIVDSFRQGKIQVLCNAELFGEGFDVPNCQAVILARPTKSLTLFIQQSLRPLRPDPDDPKKVAVIIDHVQNYLRHGLPNSAHDWSLNPNPKKIEGTAPFKRCEQCEEVVPLGCKVCPECGFEFVTEEDEEARLFEHTGVSFRLKNDTKSRSEDNKIIHAPKTPEDFLEIAKAKKYQIGWVAFQALNFATSYEDCVHIADICGYKKGWAWHKWNELSEKKFFKPHAKKSSSQNIYG